MFSVKLVARPDPRMVEVPLEIEAELPREFDGAALLASSGLPRKVKLKAPRDALKLSTAYRADQLLADVVRISLRGTAADVQRVRDAAIRFVRGVRERRQDGATLTVSANGRGRIDVVEAAPPARGPAPLLTPPELPRAPPASAGLARRLSDLEAELAERVRQLEERLTQLSAQVMHLTAVSDLAGPGIEARPGSQSPREGTPRRATAVEAYAEGLRAELRARAAAAIERGQTETSRADKAAALAAEAEFLGAARDGTALRLRDVAALAAARLAALRRLSEELDLYLPADLPVANQLLSRLEEAPSMPDAAASLEPVAQAVVRAALGADAAERTSWLTRAAALCSWELVSAEPGSAVDTQWQHAVNGGGPQVASLASPGLRRPDGSGIVRARVLTASDGAETAPDGPAQGSLDLGLPPLESTGSAAVAGDAAADAARVSVVDPAQTSLDLPERPIGEDPIPQPEQVTDDQVEQIEELAEEPPPD